MSDQEASDLPWLPVTRAELLAACKEAHEALTTLEEDPDAGWHHAARTKKLLESILSRAARQA